MKFQPTLIGWGILFILGVFILLFIFNLNSFAIILASLLGPVFVIFMMLLILKGIWDKIFGKKEAKK